VCARTRPMTRVLVVLGGDGCARVMLEFPTGRLPNADLQGAISDLREARRSIAPDTLISSATITSSNRPRGILIGSRIEKRGNRRGREGRNSGNKADAGCFYDCHFANGTRRAASTREAINDAECIISASPYSNPLVINGPAVNLICGRAC